MSDLDEDEVLPFAQHIGELIYQGSQLAKHCSPDSIRDLPIAERPAAARDGWQLYGLLFGQLLDALRHAQKTGIGEQIIIAELQDTASNAVGLVSAQFEDDEPGSVLSAHLLEAMAAMAQNRKQRPTRHEPVLLRSGSRSGDRAIKGNIRDQVARSFAIAAMRVLRDTAIVGGDRKPPEKTTGIAVAEILAGGTIQLSTRASRNEAGTDALVTEQAVLGWMNSAENGGDELADHMETQIREAIKAAPTETPLETVTRYAESLAALRKV